MTEYVTIHAGPKAAVYQELIPQLQALIQGEPDAVANMANIAAGLKMSFPAFSWVGFYLKRDRELVLGPFQGKPACVRIEVGKGVCGTACAKGETLIVPDVHAFPGHIACDPDSRSEIVVPVLHGNECYGVLDVDSYQSNAFDEDDAQFLGSIAALTASFLAAGV